MVTYVGLMSSTEEGMQTVKETTKRAIGKSTGVCRSAVVAGVLAFSGGNFAFALDTCLSGYEVSAGSDVFGVTQGVTFAGIDNLPYLDGGPNPAACDRWTTSGNGGSWTAKIDRVGVAGIGGSGVTVVGGRWYRIDRDNHVNFGRVEGGYVTWPPALDQEILGSGCGAGVAQFTLTVRGLFTPGTFVGCLDDTHLDPTKQPFIFPPRIWGTLRL